MSKRHEKVLMDRLNDMNLYDTFTAAEDEYSAFDIENADYIIEYKNRHQHYSNQVFEELKMRNVEIAEKSNRQFIYIVKTTKHCYAWNISKMVKDGYEFVWNTAFMPATTDFLRRQLVEKSVCFLEYEDATIFKL